jgi:outer membrane protein OmpA-like peptidoglycan-associated protein
MRNQRVVTSALVIALAAAGCGIQQREWGTCAIAGGVIGGVAGGITGGAASNNIDDDTNDSARGGAIAGGIVGGAVLGALLGHVVCDPLKEPQVVEAPPPPAPIPAGTEIAELQGAHFAFDSDALTAAGEANLDTAVTTLRDHPDIKVVCEGHTDSVGSESYNEQLGQRRADSVRDYLVAQGIDASRVRSTSFGESQPQASNDTAEGRAENRRVEVVVE